MRAAGVVGGQTMVLSERSVLGLLLAQAPECTAVMMAEEGLLAFQVGKAPLPGLPLPRAPILVSVRVFCKVLSALQSRLEEAAQRRLRVVKSSSRELLQNLLATNLHSVVLEPRFNSSILPEFKQVPGHGRP
jgi:hypothetical protein